VNIMNNVQINITTLKLYNITLQPYNFPTLQQP
jgi:hypothetical protein